MHRRKENLYPKELNKNIFLLLHKLEIQLYDWNKYTVEIRGTNICFRGTKVKPYLHNQKSIEIFHANKIERRKNLYKYNRNLQDDGKKKNGKNLQITSNIFLSLQMIIFHILVCSSFKNHQQSKHHRGPRIFSHIRLIFTDFDETKEYERWLKKNQKENFIQYNIERERERKGCIATIFPSCFSRSRCATTAPFAPLFLYKRGKEEAVVLPPR